MTCLEVSAPLWHDPASMTAPDLPTTLGIIAGKGAYPLQLAQSARAQGVEKLFAVAFYKETFPEIEDLVDDVVWVRVGQLRKLLDAFEERQITQAVMAGQITPSNLFRLRPDRDAIEMLASLPHKNAHTIFGAISERLEQVGVVLRAASMFMESSMPDAGLIGTREPTEQERMDIELGLRVARTTSDLDIGQTVVVKDGTILAVEAFEGTDATIRRAGKVGRGGGVVVKVAKGNHDMRFDIPVIGTQTMKNLKKAKITTLAVEAGRCILLEREKLEKQAAAMGICFIAMPPDEETH